MTSDREPDEPSVRKSPRPDANPSFRDRIEGHPIGILLGVAVAAITATLAVVVPVTQLTQDNRASALEAQMQQDRTGFQAQLERERSDRAADITSLRSQLQQQADASAKALEDERARAAARIDELDRSLAGIQRSLGSDTEYFDVGSLVVSRDEASTLPADSIFFPDLHWYALDVSQHPGWTYEVTTELRMTADLLGVTEDRLRQGSGTTAAQIEAMTRFPVHLWRFGDDRPVTFTDPGTGQTGTIHPRTEVSVQRVSHDDYIALLAESLKLDEKATEVVRTNLLRDPAGWVLQDQLATELQTGLGLRPTIESLQKRDSVAYARVETTLPDATVAGVAYDEYYWSREWLIISTADDFYLVKLFVADDDHRSPDYAATSAWLDLFRVLGS